MGGRLQPPGVLHRVIRQGLHALRVQERRAVDFISKGEDEVKRMIDSSQRPLAGRPTSQVLIEVADLGEG
ncbi:MAG: hypothetical protein QOD01_2611 [Actinomycetota bacterium]|nr:hypothetical protein [Actinomycetota bacterium]